MMKVCTNRIKRIAQQEVNFDLRYNHCAFIISKDKILAKEVNQKKTHPLIIKYGYKMNAHLHAELAVVIKHGITNCHNSTLVVVRVRSNGDLALSKPCDCCSRMIFEIGFRSVYFSTDDGTLEEMER